jgi:predicted nucleic acid-binding protein
VPIVTSAETVYVDPSALRSLYLHDASSKRFCAWRAKLAGPLVVTRHGYAELVNSVALGVFRGVITADVARRAEVLIESDLREGELVVMDVLWRRCLDLAAELSRKHTAALGTRTLDVLHVASALTLGRQTFVTYDERQAALARAVKLKVVAP